MMQIRLIFWWFLVDERNWFLFYFGGAIFPTCFIKVSPVKGPRQYQQEINEPTDDSNKIWKVPDAKIQVRVAVGVRKHLTKNGKKISSFHT
jgi:hypothetical protein